MVSPPRLLRTREFWSLKVELEWVLMKSCEQNTIYYFINGDNNLKVFFSPKPQRLVKCILATIYDHFYTTAYA